MRVIKQNEPGLCLAACVAMVCRCSLEEVLDKARILKSEDGTRFLPDNEAIKFLAGRMLCYGLRIKPDDQSIGDAETFTCRITLADCPAILSVVSENFKDHQHAVVWDNESGKVLDPLHDDPQELSKYKVNEWVPVSHV